MITEGQITLLMAAAAFIGGVVTHLWKAFQRWLKKGYRSKEEIKEEEFKALRESISKYVLRSDFIQLEQLVIEVSKAAHDHFKACNETPNSLLLRELENLTNLINAHIRDKAMHGGLEEMRRLQLDYHKKVDLIYKAIQRMEPQS